VITGNPQDWKDYPGIRRRIWNISDTICSSDDTYDAGELYQIIVYNENYNTSTNPDAYSVEYKNKQGKVILKESYTTSETLRTYYIYDDFGLLRYVFPPEYSDSFSGSSGSLSYNPSTAGILNYCYYYSYDDRHRMVEKQLPGAERVYMVYDYRDRLVGIQDGELRKNNEWICTKYDVLNRPVITFKLSYTFAVQPRQYYQGRIDLFYDQEWVEYYEVPTSTGYGYSDQSYPLLSQAYPDTILTVTYYDNYDFLSLSGFSGLSFDKTHTIDGYYDDDGNDNGYFDKVRGQVTGTKSLMLDGTGTTWINASTYYDDRYRPIQECNSMYPSGTTIVSNDYDFVGKAERSKETQTFGSNTTEMLTYYTYDHSGRLMETSVSVDQATPVVLAQNTYNELGELVEKELHLDGQSAGLQQIDYGYNIRGWLTGINDVNDLSTDGDYFAMDLMYDEIDSNIGNTSQHNGNISGVKWAKTDSSDIQAYAFGYDPLNRILSSDYRKKVSSTWSNLDHFETSYSYDLNGNINTLTRNNSTGTSIDNVAYTYDGNQLDEIDDGASPNLGVIDDNDPGQDYTYDMNGNMTRDLNKGLDVDYNYLNLPKKVYEIGGVYDEISYIYDASGVKWLKKVDNGSLTNIAYCGSFVYKDAGATGTYELDYVMNSEGRIEFDQAGHTFHYLMKDHLGNTRVEFDEDQNVNQLVDYYPFGMTFSTSQLGDDKYLFNGKELQDEQLGNINLDWYDYGARMYDPALGRWHTVDPIAEYVSPYIYVGNNPISYIDPFGLSSSFGYNYYFGGQRISEETASAFMDNPFWGDADIRIDPALYGGKFDKINGHWASVNFYDPSESSEYLGDAEFMIGAMFSTPIWVTNKAGQNFAIANAFKASNGGDNEALAAVALGMVIAPEAASSAAGALILGGIATVALTHKMSAEIERIQTKVNNIRGTVYELRVNNSGTYVDVRGNPTQMNAGDVWKYGETTGYRYSGPALGRMVPGGVHRVDIFPGNVVEIKVQEKIMIYGYTMMNGHLPPGNRIFR
jgi:RHS repeat-associated protein